MKVSIIIPYRDEKDDIDGLLKDISGQKASFETEVVRIANIYPPGKARNAGARKAKGDILVFLDCDIHLGNEQFLANLVNVVAQDRAIGMACASIRIPPGASGFQTRYAREVPHSESPIADKITDVFVASSACCAIYKDAFFKIGGFNEDIIRGEDSVLSHQFKKAGYRVVLTPRTWCYHPQPDNLAQLIETQLKIGRGVAFVDIFYPALNIDVHPKGIIYYPETKGILNRVGRFLSSSFEAIFKFKILLVLSKLFYAVGYFYGSLKYRISGRDI